MHISDPWRAVQAAYRLLVQIARLPLARLRFELALNPRQVQAAYRHFTKPHPRFPVVRNKSLGIALIKLSDFATPDAYRQTMQQKDYAAYHSKKAQARGYTVAEIDRNRYIDDIYHINTSLTMRQGRPMDAAYLERHEHYEAQQNFRYYGVLNAKGRLVAYCNIGIYGDFAATDQVLGYKNNDGVMYLLLMEIVCRLIAEGKLSYFMYDTYLGAQPGLRSFKQRLGFQPYRIRFSLQ